MNGDLDLLVLGAHPDDAEVHVGGILALAARDGLRAAILDLTSGDLGTRGTPPPARPRPWPRRPSWGCSGSSWTCPTPASTKARPTGWRSWPRSAPPAARVLILPAPEDRHPDHRRAFRLGREAAYYAGLRNYPCPGEPWRPGRWPGWAARTPGSRTWWWT